MDRKDGEFVKLGGMITAAKKIRTRAGSMLMFATLDDLEGAVELMVFEKTLATAEAALQLDEIVMVKGRVDHKEAGKVTLIVQDVERFDPSDAEIERARESAAKAAEPPKPLRLVLEGEQPASVLAEVRRIIEDFPGETPLELMIGERILRFGNGYKVEARVAAPELRRLLSTRALVTV